MLLLLLLPIGFPLPQAFKLVREVIGGREAKPRSRPYMACVKMKTETGRGTSLCRGFLIQENVVVTAAHCNSNLGITVLLGAHNIAIKDWGSQEIRVHCRIPHPEYNDRTKENDIMLLQLVHKARLTPTICTIPLSVRKVKVGATCSVAGWGRTNTEINARHSLTLQEVELKVMDKCICLSRPYMHYVPSRMLCVGDPWERKASFQVSVGKEYLTITGQILEIKDRGWLDPWTVDTGQVPTMS
uniref:Peptidase S1 domain-containing protein n=1 Tax=Pelusios castaneus TaxID=367368 RepID=A0A8C8S2A1_9SAUR